MNRIAPEGTGMTFHVITDNGHQWISQEPNACLTIRWLDFDWFRKHVRRYPFAWITL